MFLENFRIRFFKLVGSIVNSYGKNNVRKRNTINIQLNLFNLNLKGEDLSSN